MQQECHEMEAGLWYTRIFLHNVTFLSPFQCLVFWNPESRVVLNTGLLLSWASGYHFAIFAQCCQPPKDIYIGFQIIFSWVVAGLAKGRNLVLTWKLPGTTDCLLRVQVQGEFSLFSSSPEPSEKDESMDEYPKSLPCCCNQTKNPACVFGWFPDWIEIEQHGFQLPVHTLSTE